MQTARQIQLRQIKETFNSVATNSKRRILLCSSSFDTRSVVIPSYFSEKDFDNVIVAKYQINNEAIQNNIVKIKEQFKEKYKEMLLNTDDPIVSADSIQQTLLRVLSDKQQISILCDITCFTRESILMLLAFFKRLDTSTINFYFVYSLAKEYPAWLSKGIKDIRSVLGFSGHIRPSLKIHLIILAGFELMRAVSVIQEFEPYQVSIGTGLQTQQTAENYNKAKKVLDSFQSHYPSFNHFSMNIHDPFICKNDISKQIHSLNDCNIIIAPMNTKIVSIGAALLAFDRQDIQLCYASPEIYNLDRVIHSDKCVFFEIPCLSESKDPDIKKSE